MSIEVQERVRTVAAALEDAGVDALLCFHGEGVPRPNVRYLSGFTGSSAALLISTGHRILFTDRRYEEQAVVESPDWELQIGRVLSGMVGECCLERGFARIGYEPEGLTAGMLEALQNICGARFVPVDYLVEQQRRCKRKDEIAFIQDAALIVDAAFDATVSLVCAGATELDIALEIDFQMRRRGSEEVAFPTIVASGPRSALPHARPTDRRLVTTDLICIDCGATVGGYRSDLTRVCVIGEPDEEQLRVHAAVLRAHDRALALVRPGVCTDDLQKAAREEFSAASINDWWRHSLGHGVGLAIHEEPHFHIADVTLNAGDVVTIEPGAYRSGWGGVRIEDLALVTEVGVQILSATPKALRVIG